LSVAAVPPRTLRVESVDFTREGAAVIVKVSELGNVDLVGNTDFVDFATPLNRGDA
jgi:hypothetical protein